MKTSSPQPLPEAIDFDRTEIVIARDRRHEPFVKAFAYRGDHVNVEHLGTLIGFFEIPAVHEDSAYIVNFLASVANKEYFAQPRRGAVESFEATLHKINLALTQLVKEGNTEWLGNLHGIVSVLEGNNFHFSATGDGALLLFRNQEGTLISEGLADKDAAIHPLKTFLEISSGKLQEHDKLLISSPELFSLCTREMIEKNALRMDNQAFTRYIRAALVNELNLGASIVIDVKKKDVHQTKKESREKAKKQKLAQERSRQKLENVFSQNIFAHPEQSSVSSEASPDTLSEAELEALRESSYTDEKTGHIYIRGEDDDLEVSEQKTSWLNSDAWYSSKNKLFLITKKQGLKMKKWFARTGQSLLVATQKGGSALWQQSKVLSQKLSPHSIPSSQSSLSNASVSESTPLSASLSLRWTNTFSKRVRQLINTEENVFFSLEFLPQFFPKKLLLIGGGILCLVIGSVWFFRGEENVPVATKTPVSSESTPQPDPLHQTGQKHFDDPVLAEITYRDTLYVATTQTIVNEATSETIPYPNGATVRLVSFMKDLGLFFLVTDQNTLLSFSPTDKQFKTNTLPEGFSLTSNVTSLHTYLTYLYLYESTSGQIYRFPRIDGGFGEATAWFEAPLKNIRRLALYESIFLVTADGSLEQFTQGKKTRDLSASFTFDDLILSEDNTKIAGLDSHDGHLAVFVIENGQSSAEISSETLVGKQLVRYDSAQNILILSSTTDPSLLTQYQLQP